MKIEKPKNMTDSAERIASQIVGEERFESVQDSFHEAESIIVLIENIRTEYKKGDDKFEAIINALETICEYSHEMPAFGVSLDDMTKDEMKKGTWIELEFGKTCKHNAMTFEALLIKVEKDSYGFNLIRRNNGKYEGRCFYISMDGNMAHLSETLESVSHNK